jgi:hypothetical protein
MTRTERRCQRGHHAEHGGNRRDADFAGKSVLQRVDFLTHGAGVADNAPRPVKRAFAFGCKTLKPRPALHQHDAEDFLELLEAGRHRRLGDPTSFRSASEVTLLGQCKQKFKLVNQEHPQLIFRETNNTNPPDDDGAKSPTRHAMVLVSIILFSYRLISQP